MSILIKGMEMPECCGYCPFEYKNYCMAKPSLAVESADRHPRCPLVPVPPHGRLIDADALLTWARERDDGGPVNWVDSLDLTIWAGLHTIIPAEEGE